MSQRIALLGIYHESNTFIREKTTIDDFRRGHLLKGPDIRKEYQDAFHEMGGIFEVLDHAGVEVVPVMYAEATPGGIISSDTYTLLLQEMMEELEKILPVDGCMVVPHGAAVSESYPDMDGHWLSLLRDRIGKNIPIIGTLDPHANVSRLMIRSTDGLMAYKTNPHLDQRQTGMEAAQLMLNVLQDTQRPVQVHFELPLAISIEQQYTAKDPCKSLFAYAARLSKKKGILSVSIILGFPYADVKEMGSSLVVISDGDNDLALDTCKLLDSYIKAHLDMFSGDKIDLSSALSFMRDREKPVLMLDMGDNVGGGSPGNSIYLLKRLEQYGQARFFICLYDPHAVQAASSHKREELFVLSLSDDDHGTYEIDVSLQQLSNGKFKETAPRHGGQVNYDMGEIAIVSTLKRNVIMLISHRIPPFSLRQLTSFNIFPKDFDIVVAKGVVAPIAAYGPQCPTIIQVNTPGVTQADMTQFNYQNRRKPLFPFEK